MPFFSTQQHHPDGIRTILIARHLGQSTKDLLVISRMYILNVQHLYLSNNYCFAKVNCLSLESIKYKYIIYKLNKYIILTIYVYGQEYIERQEIAVKI